MDHPVPLACDAVTVERRGDASLWDIMAAADAGALAGAMTLAGAIDAPPPALPSPQCKPTSIAAVELLVAPIPGALLLLHRTPGTHIGFGSLGAEVVDPMTGSCGALHARYAGVLFAQKSVRFVAAGRPVTKIAGTEAGRSGALLGT